MKLLKRNCQEFYYCEYLGTESIIINGVKTGEKKPIYSAPIKCYGSKCIVSQKSDYATINDYGTNDGYYSRILIDTPKVSIDENSVLFVDKEPSFDSDSMPIYDYIIVKCIKTLNYTALVVKKVNK